MKRAMLFASVVTAILLALVPQAQAGMTLVDMNAWIKIETGAPAGLYEWSVDGTSQLYQQWYWYRIGDSGPEHSIDTIGSPITNSAGNWGAATYANSALEVTISYLLFGGDPGTGTADVAETLRVRNLSESPIDLHLFHYTNFDLNGGAGNQVVSFPNWNAVDQTGNGLVVSQTVMTPRPTFRRASAVTGELLALLQDGSPTTLVNNSGAGPGDASWLMEWDIDLPARGTFILSTDNRLATTPEPSAIMLLAGGLLVLAGKLRKR